MRFKKIKDSANNGTLVGAIKKDIVSLLWIILYVFGLSIIVYMLLSSLPVAFAYVSSMTGAIIGLDFSSMTNADIAYWTMCSLGTSSVFAAIIIMLIKVIFKKWKEITIDKHIKKDSEGKE